MAVGREAGGLVDPVWRMGWETADAGEVAWGGVADRPPEESSLAEQQRAAFARALVRSPACCWPTSPPGTRTRAGRSGSARPCAAAATPAWARVATHEAVLVEAADRVVVLRDGVVASA